VSAPDRVLVVCTRRIGDVLLATPLLRSLRAAWPRARIDALVFRGTEGILAANPDLTSVVTIAERPGRREHLRLLASLWRRYELALALQTGDRPTLYATLAGRTRIGLQALDHASRWKRRLLGRWVAFDDLDTHAVRMNLALARALGVEPRAEVVAAYGEADRAAVAAALGSAAGDDLAVLHPYPKFNYKQWHRAGWIAVGEALAARGLTVALTGGPDAEERAYVASIAGALPRAIDLGARLTLPQTAALLAQARLYVGPDTVVTHMAAALGTPTVALFGPSNPVRWGPWPRGWDVDANPWQRTGTQRRGNVLLLQGTADCAPGVPCLAEGCQRQVTSYSRCLQELPAERVIRACEAMQDSAASEASEQATAGSQRLD
jgi:heptosyltransferase-3